MALLANLDLQAVVKMETHCRMMNMCQNAAAAQSFLPIDKHVALGVASTTLSRFANDIWHSQLREDDVSHPFPQKRIAKEIGLLLA
ncbi:MAG: hypothetical protein R2728_09760 [Chitinophagales bacterium]